MGSEMCIRDRDLVRIGWILATQFYYIESLKEEKVWRITAALYLRFTSLTLNKLAMGATVIVHT